LKILANVLRRNRHCERRSGSDGWLSRIFGVAFGDFSRITYANDYFLKMVI